MSIAVRVHNPGAPNKDTSPMAKRRRKKARKSNPSTRRRKHRKARRSNPAPARRRRRSSARRRNPTRRFSFSKRTRRSSARRSNPIRRRRRGFGRRRNPGLPGAVVTGLKTAGLIALGALAFMGGMQLQAEFSPSGNAATTFGAPALLGIGAAALGAFIGGPVGALAAGAPLLGKIAYDGAEYVSAMALNKGQNKQLSGMSMLTPQLGMGAVVANDLGAVYADSMGAVVANDMGNADPYTAHMHAAAREEASIDAIVNLMGR